MKVRAPAPIVTALIVVFAVAAAWAAFAPPALERFESIAASVIERKTAAVLDDLGVSVSWAGASPRLYGAISFDGVELRMGGTIAAGAASVMLRYDPRSLLSGRFVIEKIRVEGLSVDSGADELAELVGRIVDLFPARNPALPRNPWPSIEVRGAGIRLALDDGAAVEASVRAADLVFVDGGFISASAAGSMAVSDPLGRFRARRAVIPFSASARLELDTLEASIAAIVSADSDLGRLASLRIDAVVGRGGARASIGPGNGLRRFEAAWDGTSGKLDVSAAFSGWRPSSMFQPAIQPRGRLGAISPWLDSSISGTFQVESDLSAGGTRASVKLSGSVPLDIEGGHPGFDVRAEGSWNALRVQVARFGNADFDASFSGDLRPATLGADGSLALGLSVKGGARIETSFDLSGSGRSWFAYAPEIRAADAVIRDTTVSVEFDAAATSFHVDAVLPPGSAAASQLASPAASPGAEGGPGGFEAASESSSPRLVVEGTAALGGKPYVEAVLRFGATRLGAFESLFAATLGPVAATALAPLAVEGEVSVYSDFAGLSYNSSRLLLVYDGAPGGFGVVSFSGGLDRLEIRSLDATIAGYSVAGTASMDFGSGSDAGFETAIVVQGIPYALSGTMMDGTVIISGDYGLRLFVRGQRGGYGADLTVVDMPLPLFGTVSFMSASASARFSSSRDWNLVLETFSLSQPPGSARPLPSISASGAFDESGGRFATLAWKDRTSSLQGAMDVTWTLGDGFKVSVNGNAAGAGGEYYVLNGEYRAGGGVDAVVSMRKAPLARAGRPALQGLLDLDVTVAGTVDDPVAAFSFTMNGGQRNENLPFAAGSGTFGGGQVTLSDTRIRIGKQNASGISLRYRLEDAEAELSADVEFAIGKTVLSGRLGAAGSSSSVAGDGSPFDDYLASGVLEGARLAKDGLGDLPFSISSRKGDSNLVLGASGEARARLGPAGELNIALDGSLPVSFNAAGAVADGYLSLDVKDARVDLPFLFDLLALPVIKVDSGVGTGSLRIRGKAIDPSVEGVIQFENFYLSVPDFVSAPIGPVSEPLYFTGRTMETLQPSVACGDASVLVSLESTLQRGVPGDIRLAVQAGGSGLVPVSTRLLGLDIEGLARPDLSIEADSDGTRINGSIMMSSGDIVLTTGLVRAKGAEVKPVNLSGSLALSFGTSVRVYFPDKRLPVIYGQADPSSRLGVSFDAASGDYNLKGNTMLRGGSVFYIQRNFYLKQATIEFDEDAFQFDPRINAEAETRTSTASGAVLVTLRAVDRRLSDLAFTLESIPAMSETALQQLLGQNLLGTAGDGSVDPLKVLVENSDLIPQLNVASIFERNLQSVLGLDLFVVRSLVFQRWLYGMSGLGGAASPMSLADYLEDTAVVAGKYLGDKLFFQLMLRLATDPLASTTVLSLDSDISIEWKAPHFTLNWSVQPKNWDSLFIEDQTFSFLWRIPLK